MWGVDIGLHGWIALILTVIGVTVLNVGLMRLARRRWDHEFERLETAEPDEIARPEPPGGDDPKQRLDDRAFDWRSSVRSESGKPRRGS